MTYQAKPLLSGTEERSGSAFEYAVAAALQAATPATIANGIAAERAKAKLQQLPDAKRKVLSRCAERAVAYLVEADKRLVANSSTSIVFNSPHNAQAHHDVRDLIVQSKTISIGVSCKVNNVDLRHSRLSGTADFVKEWGLSGGGASRTYWQAIEPVFKELRRMDANSLRWDQVFPGDPKIRNQRKLDEYVSPILDSWFTELVGLVENDKNIAQKLARYLLGSSSYWKIAARTPATSHSAHVDIQRFNLNGDMPGALLTLPTEVLECSVKQGSQSRERLISCDNGFVFGFRLHTAESEVKPSLKFAVKARTLPADLASVRLKA